MYEDDAVIGTGPDLDARYVVQVRPARWGWYSWIRMDHKTTRNGETTWSLGPFCTGRYWRPREEWAIRRALRERRLQEAHIARLKQTRDVV